MAHTEPIIDPVVKRAARRAFIRTLAQGYESALSGIVVSTTGVLAFVQNPDTRALLITAGVWAVTPFIGATSAYLSIIRDGIPVEYFGEES